MTPARTFLFLIFSFTVVVCSAQSFIGDKRSKVKKDLEKFIQSTAVSVNIMETDSSLVVPMNDPKYKPVDFLFLFDGDDKCIAEIRTGCDSCVAKYFQQAFEDSRYDWKQTSVNKFLSDSRHRLVMELVNNDKGSSLVIRRISVGRREFEVVRKQAKYN